mmetsp:Transcript_56207/g.131626  ORF Transcript_56207/g.131626 Transcript_56207/m.131626 type:complete len:670 (-) Transcript_56207:130-2139(-)
MALHIPQSPAAAAHCAKLAAAGSSAVNPHLDQSQRYLRHGLGSGSNFEHQMPPNRTVVLLAAGAAAVLVQRGCAALGRQKQMARGGRRFVLARRAEAKGELSEAEKMFREAYEAEVERSKLIKQQLEKALMKQLQEAPGMQIALQDQEVAAGGTDERTWRMAYEEAKARTESMEVSLQKAKGASSPPPAPAAAVVAEPVKAEDAGKDADAPKERSGDDGLFGMLGGIDARELEGLQETWPKLEDLYENTFEDEATQRLIVSLVTLNTAAIEEAGLQTSLPSSAEVREIVGNDEFQVSESVDFKRLIVLKGATATGTDAGVALAAVTRRFAEKGLGDTVEVYIAGTKQEGKSALLVMLKEDMPQNDFPWWLSALVVVCFIICLFTANATTFTLSAVPDAMANMQLEEMAKFAADKTVPTAGCIFATLIAQEVARRVVAKSYDVELTPPFFIPVWPFPSVGVLGGLTRRLTAPPNREAELAMSLAPSVAGLAVALGLLAAGLSQGLDPNNAVNLNFQTLPAALKLILKPLLGSAPVTAQPDPFQDPINLAFPANPVTIGGVVSLVIVCLNLLPIGRLDGGILARGAFDANTSGFLGFVAFGLLLAGTFGNPETGADMYFSFGLFCILLQGGFEAPPKDSVSDANDGGKLLAAVLVIGAILLSIPGNFLPNA